MDEYLQFYYAMLELRQRLESAENATKDVSEQEGSESLLARIGRIRQSIKDAIGFIDELMLQLED